MMVQRTALALALLAGWAVPAAATPLPRYGAFVFSSFCTEEESTDAEGYRLILVRLPLEDHVIFEWSEGPLVASTADHVVLDGDRISFQIPPDNDQPRGLTVRGILTDDAFTIDPAPAMPSQRNRLARVDDYAQVEPYCVPGTSP